MAQRISRAKRADQGVRRAVPAADRRESARTPRRGAARPLSDLQRRVHEQQRPGTAAQRSVERSHPTDARVASPAARRERGRGTAGAHAAHRCAARGANRPGRRVDSAHGAGSAALGSQGRSRKASRSSARRFRAERSGPYQLQAAIAALHDEALAPRRPTGRRSWRSTVCSMRMSDNPMVALNHAIAAAMVHGPAAGLEAARSARRRQAAGGPLSPRRGTGAPLRDGRRSPSRDRHYQAAASRDHEHSRAELPQHQGCAAHGGAAVTAGPACGILCA